MTIHETRTQLAPAEVIGRARSYFAPGGSPYAASVEAAGEGCVRLHVEVGEMVIAALPRGEWTLVRASASRGAHLLASFLTTLAAPLDAKQTTHRRGVHEVRAAQVEPAVDLTPAKPEPSVRSAPRAA